MVQTRSGEYFPSCEYSAGKGSAVAQDLQSAKKVAFGLFEADLHAGELRKSGMRIRLQGLPFRVLRILIERDNEIVSREELQALLWRDGTTVDFDHSLGTAVNKIRQALGDSAENPRFIETVARRGYRFIAPLRFLPEAVPDLHRGPRHDAPPEAAAAAALPETPAQAQAAAEEDESPPTYGARLVVADVPPFPFPAPPAETRRAPRIGSEVRGRKPLPATFLAAALASCAFLVIAGLLVYRTTEHAEPLRIKQLTFSGTVSPGAPDLESLSAMATDGPRVFVPIIRSGTALLSQVSVADGQTKALDLPSEVAGPAIGDISPEGDRLLVRNHLEAQAEQALWIVPTLGSEARRIPNVLAHDATWMPDGHHVLFANGTNLFIATQNGDGLQKFADVPGRAFWMRWSPDGSVLRFTLLDPLTHVTALWEIRRDGTNAHALLGHWNAPAGECCGSWTADGRYFVFESSRGSGQSSNIWAIDYAHGWLHPAPFALTQGPLSYRAPVTARTGHQIYFLGLNTRADLLRYDVSDKMFKPLRPDSTIMGRTEFSHDGQWMAWINQFDGSLWRSRADGSERLQLTSAPMQVFRMHWSPDDRQLALMGREPGTPWKVSLIANSGGSSGVLLDENRNEADPDWSPDGRQLVIGRLPELMAVESAPKAILIVDVATHKVTTLPGSEGLFSPRWSPDGRYISAFPLDQSGIRLYNTTTHTWKTLVTQSAADPAWSHDGKWIFFHSFAAPGSPIFRVNAETGELVRITGLGALAGTDAVDYFFSGVMEDDSPVVTARISTANLYSLDFDAR